MGRHLSTAAPRSIGPVRSLGPAKSIRILHSRPCSSQARRKLTIIFFQAAASSWAQFTRMQSMPCATKSLTSATSLAASLGTVTMMCALPPDAGPGPNNPEVDSLSSRRLPSKETSAEADS